MSGVDLDPDSSLDIEGIDDESFTFWVVNGRNETPAKDISEIEYLGLVQYESGKATKEVRHEQVWRVLGDREREPRAERFGCRCCMQTSLKSFSEILTNGCVEILKLAGRKC